MSVLFMKNQVNRAPLTALPLVLLAAFPFSFSLAQPRETSLSVTVVTATRNEIDTTLSPVAATVVSSEDIGARNVSKVSDALVLVPGFYRGQAGDGQMPSFTGNFSLRGMDAGRTLVLLDGAQPLQNANSQRVNWLTPLVDDIERVEVAPGAFSSLYGSNAIGGVVNIIGKRPDKREITARMRQGFGDASGQEASFYFRDRLTTGLGIALGASRGVRDGYVGEYVVREPVTGAAGTAVSGAIPSSTTSGGAAYVVGDRGRMPWTQSNALLKFSYDIDARQRLTAGFSQAEAETGYTRFNTYLTNTATGAPVYSGTLGIEGRRVTLTEANFLGTAPLLDSSKRWFAGYEGTVGKDSRLKVDVARIERESRFSGAGTSATWQSGTGTLTSAPDAGWDSSVVLSMPWGLRHLLVTGVALHRDAVQRTSYDLSSWRDASTVTGIRERYNGRSELTSGFVQDEYAANEQVTLYLGGRLERWETAGDYWRNMAPVSTSEYPLRGQTAFNPRASVVYKPVEDWTWRASAGQSFRAPTLFEMYSISRSQSGVVTEGDPNLRPEIGTSWELGSEWRVRADAKLFATYYETELRDMIYRKNISSTLIQRVNAGKARVKGLEIGGEKSLLKGLTLRAHASWIDAVMLDNPADPASVGKKMTDVPDQIGYLGLTYARGPWSGVLEASHTAKVYSTAANTDTASGVFGSYDAHTMVNLKSGYQVSPTVRFNLSINNVLDSRVFQYAQLPRRNATAELVVSY